MKFVANVGVVALALTLAALPLAACMLPGATTMTPAERDCCKKMVERCGGAGMGKSHSCCHDATAQSDLQALKTSAAQYTNFSFEVSHGLPVSTQLATETGVSAAAFQLSDVHSPPGLESLTTTILRI